MQYRLLNIGVALTFATPTGAAIQPLFCCLCLLRRCFIEEELDGQPKLDRF